MLELRHGTEERPALLSVDKTGYSCFPRVQWAPQGKQVGLILPKRSSQAAVDVPPLVEAEGSLCGQERQSQVSCRTNYLICRLVQNENAGVGVPTSPFANFLGPNPQGMSRLQDCCLC